MPHDFSLADIASIQPPVPNPYAPAPSPVGTIVEPSKADFSLSDVVNVKAAAPTADFLPSDVISVATSAPRVYTPDTIKSATDQELLADKDFIPVNFGAQNLTAVQSDPALREKLVRLYQEQETRGTSAKDKLKAVFTGLPEVASALAKGAVETGKAAGNLSLAGVVISPERALKSVAEVAASVENAEVGASDLIRRSIRNAPTALKITNPVLAAADKAFGGGKNWNDKFFDDVAGLQQTEAAGKANGALMTAFGFDAAALEKDYGIKVNPETINELSAITDPINFIPLGGAVGAVGKIGGKIVTRTIAVTGNTARAAALAKTLNAARDAVTAGTGNLVAKAGGGVEGAAAKVQALTKSAGGTISGLGLGSILGGDIYSALGGAAVVKGVPAVTKAVGAGVRKAGEMIAGRRAVPGALQLAADTATGAVGGFVKGAAEGAVLTLPFEIGARPDEEQFLLGASGLGGVTRGGIDAVAPTARVAGRAAQNKLAETIFRHVEQAEPAPDAGNYGTDAALDAAHAQSVSKLQPAEAKLVNWARALLRAAGGEVYVVPGAEFKKQTGYDARGYAVSAGERVSDDGVVKPVFRILLSDTSEALPHEFFHALESLDPKKAADFKSSIASSLTPEQRAQFAQLYNSRINGGKPEKAWTLRLNEDQISSEVTAEVFSRLLLAQDLSGVESGAVQKGALFVSGLLEKLGAPLGGIAKSRKNAGVSNLGVRPSTEQVKAGQAWLSDMVGRVNDSGTLGEPPKKINFPTVDNAEAIPFQPTETFPEIQPAETTPAPVTIAPEEIKPVVATPPPAEIIPAAPVNPPSPRAPAVERRNIRTTRAEQGDFAGQRAEVTNVEKARTAATEPKVKARVEEIAPHLENGTVLEIVHQGATAEGGASPRSVRRAEQESSYIAAAQANAPRDLWDRHQKVFVPVRFEIVAGKPQLLAMSMDKVLANAHQVAHEAAMKGVGDLIPYKLEAGKLTDAAWNEFVGDLQSYNANQANGHRGDGNKLVRPDGDAGLSIPAENPDYTPIPLAEDKALFLNLVQGLNPPLTAREVKGSVPGNVKGQILAEVNARTPEKPAVIRPSDISKQTFSSGRQIMETNPLRNELAAAGVDVRELIEVTERINVSDIETVTPRPDLNFDAPVTDTIRGGFLPADLISNELEKIVRGESDGVTFNADGTVFSPGDRKLDVVTLASRNVLLSELTPENVRSAVDEYSDLLTLPDTKPGVFKMSNGREVSIDLNVVVDQKHRDNTLKFARDNNQEAIFDFVTFESVPTDGTGKTVLTDSAAISEAARKLVNGESVDVAGSFLPTPDEVLSMSADEFNKAARSWPGGQRNVAYELGLNAKSEADVVALREAQQTASADRKRFMAARDLDNGVASALKAQFFREAYEAATDTGGSAGEIGWRSVFPDREAPFPQTEGAFLPGRKVKTDDIAMEVFRKANPDWDYPPETDLNDLVIQPKASKAKTPKNSTAIGAAAWILPDGEVRSFKDAAFHEQDLAANSADYNKRFGTKFGGEANVEDRLTAVNAGFVRLRNAPGRGLVVEASADRWNSIKPKLAKVLADNADNTVMLSVTLLNRKGNEVAGDSLRLAGNSDRAGAIKELLNEIKPPGKGGQVTDVQRIRALPGDFLPKDLEITSKKDDRLVTFEAFSGGNRVGVASFNVRDFQLPSGKGVKGLHPVGVFVEEPFRRQGIATALYREAKKDFPGFEIEEPARGTRTEAGKAFRAGSKGDFLPKEEADAVDKPAMMTKDGRIFTGSWHGEALLEAIKAGLDQDAIDSMSDGWVTKGGEFLSRTAAYDRTVKLKQMPTPLEYDSGLHSGFLESNDFENKRKFLPADNKAAIFYSELQKVVEEKVKGKTVKVSDLGNLLRNSGVKPEEIKWSGLDDFARGKESVDTGELKQWLKNNDVRIEEVVKENSEGLTYNEQNRLNELNLESDLTDSQQQEFSDLVRRSKDLTGGTKFENYQVPGGENYKELLLTLPGADMQRKLNESAQRNFDKPFSDLSEPERRATIKLVGGSEKNFKSSHWDEPNVLAHVRFNERTDAEGGRVLFVEEVQSDWHQKGRSQGYAGTLTEKDLPPGWTLTEKHGLWDVRNANGELNNYNENKQSALAIALGGQPGAVPDAPFKKTWPLLAVKRMIRYAAEGNFDKLAWTPGDVQAERYDLSKQVDSIQAFKNPDGKTYDLSAYKDDNKVVSQPTVKPEDISGLVGKDLATKILVGEGFDADGVGTYTGDNLKVGGEGMRGFYDEILPKEVGNYVKKWGSKVEKTAVPGQQGETRLFPTKNQALDWANTNLGDHEFSIEVDTPTQKWRVYDMFAHEPVRDLKNLEAWSLKITPEMKTDVLTKGQKKFLPVGSASGIEVRAKSPKKNISVEIRSRPVDRDEK